MPPASFSPGTVGASFFHASQKSATFEPAFGLMPVKKRHRVKHERQYKAPVQPLEMEGKEADFLKTRHLVSRQTIPWPTLYNLTRTVQQITAQKGFKV